VALISDTGMRLSEAAGLSKGDIYLDEEVPYVGIKRHPWRRLKTAGSSTQDSIGWDVTTGSLTGFVQ